MAKQEDTGAALYHLKVAESPYASDAAHNAHQAARYVARAADELKGDRELSRLAKKFEDVAKDAADVAAEVRKHSARLERTMKTSAGRVAERFLAQGATSDKYEMAIGKAWKSIGRARAEAKQAIPNLMVAEREAPDPVSARGLKEISRKVDGAFKILKEAEESLDNLP